MSEPTTDPDGELLSAWLAGDLDDAEAATLERRLEAEPVLGERLDRLVGVLLSLRGLDAVEVPADVTGRLRDRLAQERGNGRPAPGVASLSAARQTPQRRAARVPWPAIATAAAALVAVVVAVPVLGRGGDEQAASDSAVEAEQGAELAAPAEEGGEAAGAQPLQAAPVPERPVITEGSPLALAPGPADEDTQEERTDSAAAGGGAAEDVLRQRFAGLPEVNGLLGLPVEEARALAEAFQAEVRAAPPFASGAAPSACLDVLSEGAAIAIPAHVESVAVDGAPGLAYVLVTASGGSATLDRAELWLVSPFDCTTEVYLAL